MIFVPDFEVSSYFFVIDAEEMSDRYASRDHILIELTAIQFIDLQNQISDAELAKEFVREYSKMTEKLHKK